ncbi:hypothetical protein RB601_002452 [Gaeumannomyces tritici]
MVSGKATASVDGKTVAETTEWEEVEGNVYFPPGALDRDLFSGPTSLHTTCGWKGEASYYTITVGGSFFFFLFLFFFFFSSTSPSSALFQTNQQTDLPKKTDKTLENAAWYYPTPKPKAEHIKDYVAFYKTKVDVTKTVA